MLDSPTVEQLNSVIAAEATVEQLNSVIAGEAIDEVLVALPIDKYGPLVETIVHLCEEQGIIVRVHAEMFKLKTARSHIDDLDGEPIVTIRSGPPDSWQLLVKRLIDIAGSAVLLLLLIPVLTVVALLIKLTSTGPVLFKQTRVGFNKRHFMLLKFRTMVHDAEQRQHDLEPLNEKDGPIFKIKNDPRITTVGKFLRRFSIDELPQLINVLKGDMSLIGPRPMSLRDVQRIDIRWHKRRFSVKPGITCLWQVNGRSDVSFDRWVRMDLEYIDTWSLGLDIKILMKTIPAVFRGSGAY